MFARLSTFTGDAGQLEEGICMFRDQVLPELEKQPGFEGAVLMADDDAQVAYSITFWKSEEELAATADSGKRLAEMAAQQLGVKVQIAHSDVPFAKFPAAVV